MVFIGVVLCLIVESFLLQLVHEELALQWAVASLPFKEMAMTHAWFFFELMVYGLSLCFICNFQHFLYLV